MVAELYQPIQAEIKFMSDYTCLIIPILIEFPAMNLRAVSIGEAVPRESFDAVVQSAFDSAVNLRLEDEDRLITLLNSEGYDLPQGVRVWNQDLPLPAPPPGLGAAAKGGILQFDSSPLTVDLRSATIWKCRIPELNLDMMSPIAQAALSMAWDLLGTEQVLRNADIFIDDLFDPKSGSPLSQRLSQPVATLVTSTQGLDVQGALLAAEKMIGLGPGITPSGDDILIGFLAGLWSTAGQNQEKIAFIRSFGTGLIQLAKGTTEISRTYILHATLGQFSSALSHLVEAIRANNNVEETARSAMRVGHSSGMDSVTGLLIGLHAWNREFPVSPASSI